VKRLHELRFAPKNAVTPRGNPLFLGSVEEMRPFVVLVCGLEVDGGLLEVLAEPEKHPFFVFGPEVLQLKVLALSELFIKLVSPQKSS